MRATAIIVEAYMKVVKDVEDNVTEQEFFTDSLSLITMKWKRCAT